jgi:hypothetical protein
VPERPLGVEVRPTTSVVVVVRGEDVLRVHSVNEPNLLRPEAGPVDGESINSHVPQCDGIERALTQDHHCSGVGGVVEELPTNIHPSRIEVLGPVTWEASSYDTKYGTTPRIPEWVGSRVTLHVVPELEVTRRTLTDPFGPVWVNSSSGVASQPRFRVDMTLLHPLGEPLLHLLVVRFEQGVLTGETAMSPTGVADPDLLDDVHRGAGTAVTVYWTQERPLGPPTVREGLRERVVPQHGAPSQQEFFHLQCGHNHRWEVGSKGFSQAMHR